MVYLYHLTPISYPTLVHWYIETVHGTEVSGVDAELHTLPVVQPLLSEIYRINFYILTLFKIKNMRIIIYIINEKRKKKFEKKVTLLRYHLNRMFGSHYSLLPLQKGN